MLFDGEEEISKPLSLVVNSLQFNNEESLLCVSTNLGFRIYEAETFKEVSKLSEYNQMNIGDIINCSVLGKSPLVAYMMTHNEKRNCVLFWNDREERKICAFTLHQPIKTFFLTKEMFIVIPKDQDKCLLFQMVDLKYITSIKNINSESICFNDKKKNEVLLAFIESKLENYVSIVKYISESRSKKIVGRKEKKIKTNFHAIQGIKIIGEFLICANIKGNKVHIYEIENYTLKYCVFLGNFYYTLSNFDFDSKFKFFMLTTDNKYIKIFRLKDIQCRDDHSICTCSKYKDADVNSLKRHSFSFYYQKLTESTTHMHCKFRFNSNLQNVAKFNLKKGKISLVESDGTLKVLNYNRKKSDNMVLEENIKIA